MKNKKQKTLFDKHSKDGYKERHVYNTSVINVPLYGARQVLLKPLKELLNIPTLLKFIQSCKALYEYFRPRYLFLREKLLRYPGRKYVTLIVHVRVLKLECSFVSSDIRTLSPTIGLKTCPSCKLTVDPYIETCLVINDEEYKACFNYYNMACYYCNHGRVYLEGIVDKMFDKLQFHTSKVETLSPWVDLYTKKDILDKHDLERLLREYNDHYEEEQSYRKTLQYITKKMERV